MAQEAFTAPCGCIWRGEEHDHQCDGWRDLAMRRDRLREYPNADRELRRIEEQMDAHMPPWMVG